MEAQLNLLTAFGETPPSAVSRRFNLRPNDLLIINNRHCTVERQLDDRIQFLDIETKDVFFKTDEEIAFLSKQGELHWILGKDFGKTGWSAN